VFLQNFGHTAHHSTAWTCRSCQHEQLLSRRNPKTIFKAVSVNCHVLLPLISANFSFTMKNAVFLDVTPCDFCKNRGFRGTFRLHHQGDKNQCSRKNVWCMPSAVTARGTRRLWRQLTRSVFVGWCCNNKTNFKALSLQANCEFLAANPEVLG
jgi:hypothetical protein